MKRNLDYRDSELAKQRKLMDKLILKELESATYADEDRSGDEIAALASLLTDDEEIPEEYRADVFMKRFNERLGRSIPDDTSPNKEVAVMYKRRKSAIHYATVFLVFFVVLGTMNIVTYASSRQNLLEFVGERVSGLAFQYQGPKVESDFTPKDIVQHFESTVLLPKKLPIWVWTSQAKMFASDIYKYAEILYNSEDSSKEIALYVYDNQEMVLERFGGITDLYAAETGIAIEDEVYDIQLLGSQDEETIYFKKGSIHYVIRYVCDRVDVLSLITNMAEYKKSLE